MRVKKGKGVRAVLLTLGMLLAAGALYSCGSKGDQDDLNELRDELGLSENSSKKKGNPKDDDSSAKKIRDAVELALADEIVYDAVCNELNEQDTGLVFYVTIDNEGVVELKGLDPTKDGGKALLKDLMHTVGMIESGGNEVVGINLVSKERTKEGSKCWIQAKYDENRMSFMVNFMDKAGKTTDKIAWDGKEASDEDE